MSLIDLSETAPGTGSLSGLLAWSVYGAGLAEGMGSLAGDPLVTFLMGGQVQGQGTLLDGFTEVLEGTLEGVGSLSGDLIQTYVVKGLVRGIGSFQESRPLPLAGWGTLQSFVEVVRPPRPICSPDIRKKFSFSGALSRGDLMLKLCDAKGNPYSPVQVTYAFYEVQKGGYRQLRGPYRRVPAKDGVGRYYATGYPGECGQPGSWVIVWTWSEGSGCMTREEEFILEAGPPLTNACGCGKYGWD